MKTPFWDEVLAVDVAAELDHRLANLVAQRRARWLLAHIHDLILEPAPAGPGETD